MFGPTWPQHGPILAPKMAPSWLQNGVKTGPKTVSEARSAPEPILGRFWDDFWSILGRCLVDSGAISGRRPIDSWTTLVRACSDEIAWYSTGGTCGKFVCFLIHAWHSLGIRLVFYLLAKCPHFSRCLQNCQKMPRRSERSERSAFVLLTYYSLITYLACGVFACFSVTCLVLAWHALGIFTYLCPHSHRCFQTSQEMPLRSERSERSTFVLLTYYLLSICLLLT